MLNIIYIQPLQESKDDISNQPCMTAYLSFVTIFNIIYQRKTGFQKKVPFVENAREFQDAVQSQNVLETQR